MNKSVLVVDDNPQHRYLLAYLLRHANYHVETAINGQDAVQKASAMTPDLILMDLQLPGTDGYEATRILKSTPALARIPVVAVTAHAMAGDKEKALDVGCVGYIEKPFAPESIADEIALYFNI